MIGTPGILDLDSVLTQIPAEWVTEGTIIYSEHLDIFWNKTWESMPVDDAVKSWNESDIDEDGSFMVIAADDGLYVSTDTGDDWTEKDPGTEEYINAGVSGTGGKAVALGNTSKEDGDIWVSSDSGDNWAEKTVEVEQDNVAGTLYSNTFDGYEGVHSLPREYYISPLSPPDDAESAEVSTVAVKLYAPLVQCTHQMRCRFRKPDDTWGDYATEEVVWSGETTQVITFTFSPATPAKIVSDRFEFYIAEYSGSPYTAYICHDGSDIYFVASGEWVLSPITGSINKVVIGDDGDTLIAFTDAGVFISSDLGDTWSVEFPDEDEGTNWTYGICSSGGNYILALAGGLYRSANGGSSWAEITPAGGDTYGVGRAAMSQNGRYMLIVGTNSTTPADSLYVSDDYGVTWEAVNPSSSAITWTECDVNGDGQVMAVSATGNFYVSFDYGSTWEEQSVPSSEYQWECLSISGDGKVGIIANVGSNDEFFQNSGYYADVSLSETELTSYARSLIDDSDADTARTTLDAQQQGDVLDDLNTLGVVTADGEFLVGTAEGIFDWESGNTARTSLGVGTGDSPTFAGLTVVNAIDEFSIDGTLGDDSDSALPSEKAVKTYVDAAVGPGGHDHDTDTLQLDGINSDGGAFSFNTTGAVTFNQAIASTNFAAANKLTACATNAGALDFSGASKTLTVEDDATVSQDYSSDATPMFAGLDIGTGELVCGSINRASGTLTIEIGGIAEQSITSTETTFGGNLVLPDDATIGNTPTLKFDSSGFAVFENGSVYIYGDGADAVLGFAIAGTSVEGHVRYYRASNTIASPAAIADGDVITDIDYYGHDGTSYQQRAKISVLVNGTVDDPTDDVPMDMVFSTGSTSLAETLRLLSDNTAQTSGGLGIASAATQANGLTLAYGAGAEYGFITSIKGTDISQNAYFDGAWKYISSDGDGAGQFGTYASGGKGKCLIRCAADGVADAVISWTTLLLGSSDGISSIVMSDGGFIGESGGSRLQFNTTANTVQWLGGPLYSANQKIGIGTASPDGYIEIEVNDNAVINLDATQSASFVADRGDQPNYWAGLSIKTAGADAAYVGCIAGSPSVTMQYWIGGAWREIYAYGTNGQMTIDSLEHAIVALDRADSTNYQASLSFKTAGADAWFIGLAAGSTSFEINRYTGSPYWTKVVDITTAGVTSIGDGGATNYLQIGANGDLSFAGSAGFYPVRIAQSAQPTPDTGELVIWRDTDDGKVYLVYNDTDSGVKQVEMT